MKLTQEDINKTEAYWRAKLSAEIYDYANKVQKTTREGGMGVGLLVIINSVGDHIGKMPEARS